MSKYKRYVGLSVSFCIGAICRGEIDEDMVAFIVPGFTINDENTRRKVWERYSKIYWSDFPEQAWEVFERIKIVPLSDGIGHNIADGCWVREEDFTPECIFQCGWGSPKLHTEQIVRELKDECDVDSDGNLVNNEGDAE